MMRDQRKDENAGVRHPADVEEGQHEAGEVETMAPEAVEAEVAEQASPNGGGNGVAEEVGGAAAVASDREWEDRVQALEADLAALNDRHLRLAAEFDNYRKRTDRERLELAERLKAELVGRLLEPLDDLERVSTVEPARATVESVLEGIGLVERKVRQVLAAFGVEEIDPLGEDFDPTTMEAVMVVPASSPEDDGTVAAVFQKGYRLGPALVRAARVQVRKFGD